MASIGDMDGDGINDIAVGAELDDDGADGSGAIWILFLNPDGTVKSHMKISNLEGNFTGTLDAFDFFGSSVCSVGDLNGDGINDIAVGALGDDDGAENTGCVWIIFLDCETIPLPTPTPIGKSFTFNCEHNMERGPIFGLESLTINVGDTENCTLKLTNLEPGKIVNVSTKLRTIFGSNVEIEPAEGVTDENGELEVTITALSKGFNWAAWAVSNDNKVFEFSKKSYDDGLAWGMFVKVK